MENENVKSFKVKKILNISLISLLVLLLLVLIAGFVRILPKDIEYTNVTSNSFTVSWSTRFPTKGVVSVVDGKNRLPIAFTSLSKVLGFDTRDIRFAELKATEESSEKIWESSSQSVSLGDIVTEKIVDEKGSYYTHHIEVRGINPESEYRVMVGDGLLFLNSGLFKEEPTLKTLEVAEGIKTPIPTYGLIKNANGQDLPIEELLAVTDGVVYFNYLEELSGERSNTYSSSLNEEGAWYMDISTAVDSEGELFFEKYSQEVSNIYGVLLIDLGPLGKWEKRINMNEASPAQTIVLNIPGYVENPDYPNMLIKVDGSNAIEEEVVKGISASGCQFVAYCGGCVEGGKECACDPAVLERRGCGSGESLEQGLQELKNATTTGCSGGSPGSSVLYGNYCKVCSPVYDANQKIKYYKWEGVSADVCADDKYKGGATQTPTDITCRESHGEGYVLKDGKCEPEEASTEITTPDEALQRMVAGDVCYVNGEARTVQRIGGENRCLVSSSPITTPDSDLQKMTVGAVCYVNGEARTVQRIGGENRCLVSSINPSEKEGTSCRDDSKNIVYGVYNSKGLCTERTSEPLPASNIAGVACSERITNLYAMSKEGIVYECKNGTFELKPSDNEYFECKEGLSCGYIGQRNNQCITSKGVLLDCNFSGKAPGYIWTVEEGAGKRGAIASSEIAKGEKCNEETCLCNNFDILYKGDICVEAQKCYWGGPYNTEERPANDGKICDTKGNTCQNGACTGPVSSSRSSFLSKAYAQENLPSEYMIDTTTGKVLGIEPGIYTLKDGEETYVFTIKTQDVKDGKGDMIVYIDSNENGIQDDGERTLSDFSSSVKINAVKKLYTYDLKEGFNFISLPFLVNDEIARTAAGLLKILNAEYHDSVYSIAKYDGTWKVVGQNVQQYDNNDFQLIPGEGYIIKANKNISIQIAGRPVDFESTQDNAPITFYTGWNLIGVYGSKAQPYTAKSLIQSINQYEPVDFTVDNVSRWESDMQRYDGFQLTNENGVDIEYGFDFPINTLQSYFVRVLQGRGNWQPDIR